MVLIVSGTGRMLPTSALCVYLSAHITTVVTLTVTGCFFKLTWASGGLYTHVRPYAQLRLLHQFTADGWASAACVWCSLVFVCVQVHIVHAWSLGMKVKAELTSREKLKEFDRS